MTIHEIPIEALFGDVVQLQELSGVPGETRLWFRSDRFLLDRWLLCNFNAGTLKAYERHERTTESI